MFTRFSLSAVFVLWIVDWMIVLWARVCDWLSEYGGWIGIVLCLLGIVVLLHVWQQHLLALPVAL